MYTINAILEALPGKEKELETALRKMIPETQKENGTLIYTLHVSKDNPAKFLFYELYKDMKAIEEHTSTPHFKELMDKTKNLLKNKSIEIYKTVDGIKKNPDNFF